MNIAASDARRESQSPGSFSVRESEAEATEPRRIIDATAFTLVELLVVIAVVSLLALLLFPALRRAKQRVQDTRCISNLHQHGIALAQFLNDNHVFPLYHNSAINKGQNQEHSINWETALFEHVVLPAARPGKLEGVFQCPTLRQPPGLPSAVLYYSYGYNSYGLMGHTTDASLGLGGLGFKYPGSAGGNYGPPLPESAVINPTETLAAGDGLIGWDGLIGDGSFVLGRMPTSLFHAFGPDEASRRRMNGRHAGKGNVLFCDAHVVAVSLQTLFSDTADSSLRMWNSDNQSHRERLLP